MSGEWFESMCLCQCIRCSARANIGDERATFIRTVDACLLCIFILWIEQEIHNNSQSKNSLTILTKHAVGYNYDTAKTYFSLV